MAIDREDALKKAEKLLRQGRIDQAITAYEGVVGNNARDWTAANALGDLYVRVGRPAEAASQYARIARHFVDDGFFPKAAALYKKILKIQPDDEEVQLELAEVSARQGLLADAKAHLTAVADRRRQRSDTFGVNQILIRLGSLDPTDFEARRVAARILEEQGDGAGAAERYREMAADLEEKKRPEEAVDALREAARLDPSDAATCARLARLAMEARRLDEAQQYLTVEVAGDDPQLLELLADMLVRTGRSDEGLPIVQRLLDADPTYADRLVHFAVEQADGSADEAFACLDLVVDRAVGATEWIQASELLQRFVARAPGHVPALLKLVEICVDGGLESAMYRAQAQLADAYLATGQATEACVIAEDLVAREPWESAHIDRFRRALVMRGTPNPDAVIAERLSGQSPFLATDPFVDVPSAASEAGSAETSASESEAGAGAPEGGDTAFRVTLDGIDLQEILEPSPSTPASASEPDASAGPAETERADREAPAGEQTEEPAGLERIFKAMRRQAESPTEGDTGAQQLALAETYLDMGMTDEAIQALEAAVRSPRHRFRAASTLGRLFGEQGELVRAVEWMERAAQAPSPTPEEGHALLYALGRSLEALGETAGALAVLLELQADAGDYEDVAARVDRLTRVQTGG